MTQNQSEQIIAALDALNSLVWQHQLLEIASECCDTYTPKNFDRVSLLLEQYESAYILWTDELRRALTNLQDSL